MELSLLVRRIASGLGAFAIGLAVGGLMTVFLRTGTALTLEASVTLLVFISAGGRLPGYRMSLKMAGVALVLAEAMAHPPVEFMDRPVGAFSQAPTLDELLARTNLHCGSDACEKLRPTRVPVPLGVVLTRRDVASAVETSLGLHFRIGMCGTGVSMRVPMHPIFAEFD